MSRIKVNSIFFHCLKRNALVIGLTAPLLFIWAIHAQAVIPGVTGTTFYLTAKEGYISTPEANSIYMWGYAYDDGPMQYPGPTLIVNQGDIITIYLRNQLEVPVSIIFPGQEGVKTIGGTPGLLTAEAPPYKKMSSIRSLENRRIPSPVSFLQDQEDNNRKISSFYQRKCPQGLEGWVGYTFQASHAGTYLYHSGTRPDLQVEMGLVGAIIVRPKDFIPKYPQAYEQKGTSYNYEYLFLLTEIDPKIHELTLYGDMDKIDFTTYWPVYWFINGRNSPDTMAPAFAPWLPHQPYNCMPRMHPGNKLLMRVIGGNRDLHPFHHHGNHSKIIARDGRVLSSNPDAGPDLQQVIFTIPSVPGQTIDAIFEWTGAKLGWDIYGHSANDPLEPHEYAPDHGKPFPVVLPEQQDLAVGAMYSGSPFLGALGALPPGEGGFNLNGGFFYMWHSHNEKEMVNFDIFPGGMMTMLIIEPPNVPIP